MDCSLPSIGKDSMSLGLSLQNGILGKTEPTVHSSLCSSTPPSHTALSRTLCKEEQRAEVATGEVCLLQACFLSGWWVQKGHGINPT